MHGALPKKNIWFSTLREIGILRYLLGDSKCAKVMGDFAMTPDKLHLYEEGNVW